MLLRMSARRSLRLVYRYGLYAVILGLLAVFLLWPIALTVRGGFGPAEGNTIGEQARSMLRYFIGETGVIWDPVYRAGLVNSLAVAVCTTFLCIVMSLPLALLAAKFDFRGKSLLSSLVLVPLILPPFVGAIGLKALLGRFGAVNATLVELGVIDWSSGGIDWLGGDWLPEAFPFSGRFLGVVVMEALHLYPIVYLNVTAALANLDPALDEAAVGLGASRWRRFRRVTLPLILPGIFAGSTIVFIWSFTELGTPLMFDFHTITPVQVFHGLQQIETNPRPYALVVVMLVSAVSLYLLGKFVFGGRAYEMQSKASIAAKPRSLTGIAGIGAATLFGLVTLLAILPHIGVLFSSLSETSQWYRTVLPQEMTLDHYVGDNGALTHPLAAGSITNSLMYAFGAMLLCIVFGLAIAYLTVRVRVRGGWALDALAMLPLAVPGLVMAFGYVAMTLRWPFDGAAPDWLMSVFDTCLPAAWAQSLGDAPLEAFKVTGQYPNPVLLLVIAYAVRRLPYVVRSATAGLEQTSGQLEEAALNLGASQFTAMRRVVIPLIMANLIAGGILAFSFAVLEVSDSLILAQKEEHFPITKAIYILYERLGDGPYVASAMGVWGMALLTVTLVGAGMLMGKRLGAIFRA